MKLKNGHQADVEALGCILMAAWETKTEILDFTIRRQCYLENWLRYS
jgi:hypothetical protein